MTRRIQFAGDRAPAVGRRGAVARRAGARRTPRGTVVPSIAPPRGSRDRVTYTIEIRLRPGRGRCCWTISPRRSCASTGSTIVGNDSSTTTDAADRTTHTAALRPDHLSRRHADALDRADLGALLPAAPGPAAAGHGAGRRSADPRRGGRLPQHAAREPADLRAARRTRLGLARTCSSRAPTRSGWRWSSCRWRPRCSWVPSRSGAAPPGTPAAGRLARPVPIIAPRSSACAALDVTTEEDRRRAYDAISTAVREHVASRAGVPASGADGGGDRGGAGARRGPGVARGSQCAARDVRRGPLRTAARDAVGRRRAGMRCPRRNRCSQPVGMRFLHPGVRRVAAGGLRGRGAAEVARALARSPRSRRSCRRCKRLPRLGLAPRCRSRSSRSPPRSPAWR